MRKERITVNPTCDCCGRKFCFEEIAIISLKAPDGNIRAVSAGLSISPRMICGNCSLAFFKWYTSGHPLGNYNPKNKRVKQLFRLSDETREDIR